MATNNQSGSIRQRNKKQRATERAAADYSAGTTTEEEDNNNDKEKIIKRKQKLQLQAKNKKKKGFDMACYVIAGLLVALIIMGLAVVQTGNSSSDTTKDTSKSRRTEEKQQQPKNPLQQEEDPNVILSSPHGITQVVKDYRVIQKFPHDPTAFTQGLTFRPDNPNVVYESTGNYKESEIRVLDLTNNGTVIQQVQLPDHYFAEGMSYFEYDNENKGLVLLTYREDTGFVLDIDTLATKQQFNYTTTTGEGWGIIHVPNLNGNNCYEYIVSDGSAHLLFWDRHYQECQPKVEVTYQLAEMKKRQLPVKPLKYVNELEWDPVTNTILANVWYQDYIARIDPLTGFVTTLYDVRDLFPREERPQKADCFNGIALHPVSGQLWVTGKWWPHLYQIELGVVDED